VDVTHCPARCWLIFILIIKYSVDLDSSSRLKSVTQERDLDEFLNTAQLAGTEFTAGANLHSFTKIQRLIN